MTVCICRRVSDHDIVRAARQGLDFDAIQAELGLVRHYRRRTHCTCVIVAHWRIAAPTAALQNGGVTATAPQAA